MVPRNLRIKGHIFTVRQVPKAGLPLDCEAYVESDKNLIRLYKRLPASRKIECLFHESIHAMLSGHRIEEEELICSLLGEYLVEFVRDNPDFIRHCLKTLEQN